MIVHRADDTEDQSAGWRTYLAWGAVGLSVALVLAVASPSPAARGVGLILGMLSAVWLAVGLTRWARRGDTPPTAPPAPPDDTPAGWYPNPDGPGRRYWTGSGWTADTAP